MVRRLGLGLSLVLASTACRKATPSSNRPPAHVYARGDRVVAEQAGAQFIEARVLAVEADRLRVQAIAGSDALKVVASDVYRLPPAAHELTSKLLAVCARGTLWQPCRLVSVGATLRAKDAFGTEFDVAREQVLVPSALTELNLARYFARTEAEVSFARNALRAGEPRLEPGWRPALHERLLVRLGADWFTGYVRELGEDSAQVTLSTPQRSAAVSLSALAAEPPSIFVNDLRRSDFVLVRPATPSEPWQRWQIRAVDERDLKLADAAGTLKSISMREVVPLRP